MTQYYSNGQPKLVKCPKPVEDLIDQIRYAMDPKVEQEYLKQLLALFDPESGRYTGP